MLGQTLYLVFVTAFVALVIFGHVLLLEALLHDWLRKRQTGRRQPVVFVAEEDEIQHVPSTSPSDKVAA